MQTDIHKLFLKNYKVFYNNIEISFQILTTDKINKKCLLFDKKFYQNDLLFDHIRQSYINLLLDVYKNPKITLLLENPDYIKLLKKYHRISPAIVANYFDKPKKIAKIEKKFRSRLKLFEDKIYHMVEMFVLNCPYRILCQELIIQRSNLFMHSIYIEILKLHQDLINLGIYHIRDKIDDYINLFFIFSNDYIVV